ncbi:MAG TPA: PLP-dependent aminotransferase family protein [Stellaceae bacterium]
MDWSNRYATRASRMAASEIRELLKLLDQPDIISFAGGIPDPALFPRDVIASAFQRVLDDPQRSAASLQYSVSEGYQPLRQWLADYMATRGVTCTADNILITNGSQQGLDFLGRLFISPGDTVLVGRPTYLGALQAFNSYEPVYDVLPGRDNNRTVESYRSSQGGGPKFGYVMPDFQNPSGRTFSLEERNELLDAAEALGMALIEDTAYEQLYYDGATLPPLQALDIERKGGNIDESSVIYCGTFSKTVVPALRIGWIVAPRPVIEKLVLVKQASDLHSSTLNQMAMHEVVTNLPPQHMQRIRATYGVRRDAILRALRQYMPAGVTWTEPAGGMFVWVTLPESIDAAALLKLAIEEARVAFVPGGAFFADRSGRNTMRLSFSLNDESKVRTGIERLGRLLHRMLSDEQRLSA